MTEVWKDIPGYEGYYRVSNLGRVKGVERTVYKSNFGNSRVIKEKITMPFVSGTIPYLRVQLSKDGINKKHSVHRLVAKAFLDNSENKTDVNHINGNKTDNRVINLEWCTKSENTRHAVDVLKRKLGSHFKDDEWKRKYLVLGPAKKKVHMFNKKGDFIKEYESAWKAEEENGITHGLVSQYCHGKRNNKLYNFKYVRNA